MEDTLHVNEPKALVYLFPETIYNIRETVEIQKVSADIPLSETGSFDYLGENNKYILILIKDPSVSKTISKVDLELLLKTLTALSLEMRDVALVNLAHQKITDFKTLKSYFSPSKCIGFGIKAEDLQIESGISLNDIQSFDQVSLLLTVSLDELSKDQQVKMVWWKAMKTLFQ